MGYKIVGQLSGYALLLKITDLLFYLNQKGLRE